MVNLVGSRQSDIHGLTVLDREWPLGLDPDALPWTVRTHNCLRKSGLLDNPSDLARLTFGALFSVQAMGCLSVVDFACVAEAAMEDFEAALAASNEAEVEESSSLLEAIDSLWAEQVSEGDPRFADLMPPGRGTVFERLEQLTSEPQENASLQGALTSSIHEIEARAAKIGELVLENAAMDFLEGISGLSGRKAEGIAARLGWSGRAPVTLREAGELMGVTRERVRQIQETVIRRIPEHPIYMPQLDKAIEELRMNTPLSTADAARLLRSSGISRIDFHPASVISMAASFSRSPTFVLDKARGCVVADNTAEYASLMIGLARRQAGSSGVSNVQEVSAQLRSKGVDVDEDTTRHYLRSIADFEFLKDDWFWCPSGKHERNRLRNVTRKMLSVASPIKVGVLREGAKRAYKFRQSSGVGSWPLAVPPRSVLRVFYVAHPEFVLRDDDYVEPATPLNYQVELGKTERTLVDVIRSSPASVLDRASFLRGCLRRGMNEYTFNSYSTYSAVVQHVGIDIWSVRGIDLNPAAVEAVRRANALGVREKRVLDHGWTDDGSLWIAVRLPEVVGNFVFGVPAAVRRFVADQSFDAVDEMGVPSGRIRVLEDGASIGYAPFLRRRGADEDDVLVVKFNLSPSRCELRLGDAERFDESMFPV